MKTELRFVGVICNECGEETYNVTNWMWTPGDISWMGYLKMFRCAECRHDYVLLFDEHRRFITVFSENWLDNFMQSAGGRKPEFDADEIPF